MTVKRMDNVRIVVEDLDAAVEFFTELGLALEGRAPIEGNWAEGVTGSGASWVFQRCSRLRAMPRSWATAFTIRAL